MIRPSVEKKPNSYNNTTKIDCAEPELNIRARFGRSVDVRVLLLKYPKGDEREKVRVGLYRETSMKIDTLLTKIPLAQSCNSLPADPNHS